MDKDVLLLIAIACAAFLAIINFFQVSDENVVGQAVDLRTCNIDYDVLVDQCDAQNDVGTELHTACTQAAAAEWQECSRQFRDDL